MQIRINLTRKSKRKFAASILTAVVLLCLFILMNGFALPKRDLIAKHYDDINWMRFIPKPIRFDKAEETAPNEEKETEIERISSQPAIERVELDILLEQFDLSAIELETRTLESPSKAASQAQPENLRIDLGATLIAGDFNLTFNEASPLLSSFRGRGNNTSAKGTVSVIAGEGEAIGKGLGTFDEDVGTDFQGPQIFGPGGGLIRIGLKKMEDFGEGYDDFAAIYKPLVEWMKLHPAELPDVVNRFMTYQLGDLTSWVNFSIENREFEMFLLCIESTYEVRLALIEQLDVTYLIDQGFRKKSNFLRVGAINRLENNEILKFGTNLRPPSDRRAEEFYQLFLSWWEEVKHEVEK